MSRIAVLGEPPLVDPWKLAGALVVSAVGSAEVRSAWDGLPDDVEVVVLTPDAAGHLGERGPGPMAVVLP